MEKRRYYSIDSDKSGEKWSVVMHLGSNPILSGFDDPDLAQEIADALNAAYEFGMYDCENHVKEKLSGFLFK